MGGLTDPAGSGGGRNRGDQPISGLAAARTNRVGGGGSGDMVSFPFYGPWGSWYPWYTGGFGWGAGFYGYNPWYYGATCWSWGRYGTWYDPYSYCWDPSWSVSAYSESVGGKARAPKAPATMGTIRLKANPATAKVYIDGALVGTVEEFNGLNSPLEVEGGRRVLKLVAAGYKDYSTEINVAISRTQTVRISMKKN